MRFELEIVTQNLYHVEIISFFFAKLFFQDLNEATFYFKVQSCN